MCIWSRVCVKLGVVLAGFMITAPSVWGQTAVAQRDPSVQIDGVYGPHLPPVVYEHEYGRSVDLLINLLHYFMAALFIGWGIFFLYCLMRFRARTGHQANCTLVKAKISKYLEIGVAVFEAVLLIGLSVPVWGSVKKDFPTADTNPLHLRVIAEQFAWNFHYPGPDGRFGRTSPDLINMATNPMGIDPGDENGKDDILSPELHIPLHRPVIADISSKDVIHSFFVPVLRVKQDAIPGMRIPVWFKAGKTGRYEVACAQLCGNNHYSMRAVMVVEEPDVFDEWYQTKSQGAEEFNEGDF